MATLNTVQEMVVAARELLQDAVVPYRYSDAALLLALNLALSEAKRIRPDFYTDIDWVPAFTDAANDDDDDESEGSFSFYVEPAYRAPFLYFMVGFVQLRDEEDTQDPRALGLMGKFSQQLLALG
jgi:hypothetical protein